MIWVFGRGGRVPYRVPYGELHESRSPIYICTGGGSPVGGDFSHDQYYLAQVVESGQVRYRKPFGSIEPISQKNCARLKVDRLPLLARRSGTCVCIAPV